MTEICTATTGKRATEGQGSPAQAWARALELTAPIARNPERIFPTVIEERAAQFGDAPALLSERECFTYRALAERVEPICPMGARAGYTQRRMRRPAHAEPAGVHGHAGWASPRPAAWWPC